MIISVTKLQLKNVWYLFNFLNHAGHSSKQANVSPGLKFLDLKTDFARLTFYTLTAWETEAQMRQFMLSEYHKEAMKATQKIAKKAISVHFDADRIPDWKEALEILQQKTEKVY